MNIRNNIETTRVVNSKINLSILKETHENLRFILDNFQYDNHKWSICADLKVVAILTGLQSGYTKYCCFLCLWDSRDRKVHYSRKEWPEVIRISKVQAI